MNHQFEDLWEFGGTEASSFLAQQVWVRGKSAHFNATEYPGGASWLWLIYGALSR